MPRRANRNRTFEETKAAVLQAVKDGNRSVSHIRMAARMRDMYETIVYLGALIDEGLVEQQEPASTDHSHVKRVFTLKTL